MATKGCYWAKASLFQKRLLGKLISFISLEAHQLATAEKFSKISHSRVKLTNIEDCIEKGYVKDGENPLEVAANQLAKDGVNILHTIGGDDTNTTAADLSAFLKKNNYV